MTLPCLDPDLTYPFLLQVKLHIESALIAIFRLSEQERSAIEVKRKEETQDTFTAITSFLGEAFSLSTN